MSAAADHLVALFSELARPASLIEVILKGTVILTLALLFCRVVRGAPAALRHLVLGLAIAGTLALPLLAPVAPHWDVAPLPALESVWGVEPASPAPTVASGPSGVAPGEIDASARADAPTPVPWTIWLMRLWLAGAALVLVRLLIALVVITRILHRAAPASSPRFTTAALRCREAVGLSRRIPLLVSDRATVPFAWGWLRPRIILPPDCEAWSDRKLEIVLLHEMAHVKRWDGLSTGVAQAAAVVYWFNPLLWLARRRLLVERECASDECVLATGVRASEYAAYLLEIVRVIRGRRWLPELQVAMGRKTKLEERIMSIVDRRERRSHHTGIRSALIVLSAALMIIVPLAGYRIFAQDRTPSTGAVAPAEQQALVVLLDDFHEALYAGDDYEDVRRRFLVADYFDDPSRTFENWTQQRRDALMHNTLVHIRSRLGIPAEEGTHRVDAEASRTLRSSDLVYRSVPMDWRVQGREIHLTHRVDIRGGTSAAGDPHLVRDLVQTLVFVEEDGAYRIARYEGGINIQRMDIDNPYGPIFIVTLDGDEAAIPTGPMLFKSIPRSIVPNNRSMIPLRAAAN